MDIYIRITLITVISICSVFTGVASCNDDNNQLSIAGSNLNPNTVGAKRVRSHPVVENAFFIDPIRGDNSNDGSESTPWKDLNKVIDNKLIESQQWDTYPYNSEGTYLVPKNRGAKITAGSTIYLKNGHYGDLNLKGYYNATPITLKAYPGHTPIFGSITITSGMNWVFDGVRILASADSKSLTLFDVINHSFHGPVSNIRLENSYISSAEDVSGWSAYDWEEKALNGVDSDANDFVLINNIIKNVAIGITVLGDNSIVENNTINFFSRDGIRPLGNYNTVQFNLIKNSVFLDNGHHDDAIQSFTKKDKPLTGSTIRSNIIMVYDNPDNAFIDEQQLQGIGLFDGPFIDWVIAENIIMVDNWHGISIYDSKNSRIINNTVVDPDYSNNISSRIMLGTKGNNGNVSITDNHILNNIVSKTATVTNERLRRGNTFEGNYTGKGKVTPKIFIDYYNYDFRLSLKGIEMINNNLNR